MQLIVICLYFFSILSKAFCGLVCSHLKVVCFELVFYAKNL